MRHILSSSRPSDDSADSSLGPFFCALHFCANLQLFAGMRYQLRLSMKCTFQQAHRIMPKFKAAGVEARLLVMPGKDHGWMAEPEEVKTVGEWFDKHLLEAR